MDKDSFDLGDLQRSYVVRANLGRSDLAEIILDGVAPSLARATELVRTFLFRGDLRAAERTLESANIPTSEVDECELELERARLLFMQDKFASCLEITETLLQKSELLPLSRLTTYQIRGHAFLNLGETKTAVGELKKAMVISEDFPTAPSAFSAMAMLVWAYADLGEKAKADSTRQTLLQRLDSVENPEMWVDRCLTVLRGEVHYFRGFSQTSEEYVRLLEALALARHLDDRITEGKCISELGHLSRVDEMEPTVFYFSSFVYLERLQVLIWKQPQKIVRISHVPLMAKMLSALCRGPISQEIFFEKIWGLPFNKKNHSVHVRANISKLRKLLPPKALIVVDGDLSLDI